MNRRLFLSSITTPAAILMANRAIPAVLDKPDLILANETGWWLGLYDRDGNELSQPGYRRVRPVMKRHQTLQENATLLEMTGVFGRIVGTDVDRGKSIVHRRRDPTEESSLCRAIHQHARDGHPDRDGHADNHHDDMSMYIARITAGRKSTQHVHEIADTEVRIAGAFHKDELTEIPRRPRAWRFESRLGYGATAISDSKAAAIASAKVLLEKKQ